MKILILSSFSDAHASAVYKHLTEMDADVDFFLLDQLQQSALNFNITNESRSCSVLHGDKVLDLESYDSIWHRRPGQITNVAAPFPWVETMLRQEATDAFYGISHPLRCRWVNHPYRDHACSRKLWQLDVAARVGLLIPNTLVTNQPDVVREFFVRCGGQVIYKLVSEYSNHQIPRFEGPGISTYSLRERDLEHIEQVKYCPHIFQKKIKKSSDIRVTIVGKRMFAVRIDSQSGKGTTDWRNDYSVAMDATELPQKTEAACLELMRELRLNYGALDFCEDEDGNLVFIEINNAGQYLWQEMRIGLPISLELAKLLNHQTPAIVDNPLV